MIHIMHELVHSILLKFGVSPSARLVDTAVESLSDREFDSARPPPLSLRLGFIISTFPPTPHLSFNNTTSNSTSTPLSHTMAILGLSAAGPSAPAHFSLESLVRPNILALQPYRCARDDYSSGVLLDANENAYGPSLAASAYAPQAASQEPGAATLQLMGDDAAALNRYPSPTHDELKRRIAKLRGVPDEKWVFLGVGSDEVIDMLYRCLCVPAKDAVMTTPPTYGMYGVCAQINDVGVVKVPLITEGGAFQLDEKAVSS